MKQYVKLSGKARRGIFTAIATVPLLMACSPTDNSDGITVAAAAPTCVVPESDFATWKNALGFKAPNSATFDDSDPCQFYKWSSQMFLWLTSKDAAGNHNLFSPTFYNAVKSTDTGDFTFVQNTESKSTFNNSDLSFQVRVNKQDSGDTSTGAEATDAETGQAGSGGVLIVKGDKVPLEGKAGYATYPVVYYTIQVNDVEAELEKHQSDVAYFQTGSAAGQFPTTADQAKEIQTQADTIFSDLDQLALEVKSSWVDVAYLSDDQASGLLQVTAEVPAFTESTTDGKLGLSWDGETMATRTVALTGMHIVGSAKGHPEMIWASMESVFNAPDTTYSFLNSDYDMSSKACKPNTNCLSTVDFSVSSSRPYIFYTGKSGATSFPLPLAQTATSGSNDTTITSTSATLVPSNVAQLNPWGSQQSDNPAITDEAVINNTLLISLNGSVRQQLPAGSALTNYFLLGAIWSDGTIPVFGQTPPTPLTGSLYLANSTMETFEQSGGGAGEFATNCFSCHSANSSNQGASVSHVFTIK